MYLCLVILSIHEDVQEALGCLKAEDLAHEALRVVYLGVVLFGADVVGLIEGVHDLGDGHADVPEHFWGARALIVQLCGDDLDDLADRGLDELAVQQKIGLASLRLLLLCYLLVRRLGLARPLRQQNQVLRHKSKSSYRTSRHLLLVALLMLRVPDAGIDEGH